MPLPIGWIVDGVGGVVGAVSEAFSDLFTALVGWVINAVMWVVQGIFNFFIDATDPNVQADWFISGDGPYATTSAIAAALMVGFLLVGITQGVLVGDVAGMLRRMAIDLPVSVLGIVALVTVTQTLIRLTDDLSTGIMQNFEEDVTEFTTVLMSLGRMAGVTNFLVLLLAFITALAGIVLVAELAIRAALIYIVVALAPLIFAARLWPALQGASRKLLELLFALILSKLVMAIALAVAASAAVGTGSGGEVTALPEPEAIAEDPGGSVTQAIGILIAATAAFGVAAFAPMLVMRLFPLAEGALVAHGMRGGAVRGGQQAMSTFHSADMLTNGRVSQFASGGLLGFGGGRGGASSGGGGSSRSRAVPKPPGARGFRVGGGGGATAASGGASSAAGTAAAAGPAAAVAAPIAGVKTAADAAGKGTRIATSGVSSTGGDGRPASTSAPGATPARPIPNRDEPVSPRGRPVRNYDVVPPPPLGTVPPPPPSRPPRPPHPPGGDRGR